MELSLFPISSIGSLWRALWGVLRCIITPLQNFSWYTHGIKSYIDEYLPIIDEHLSDLDVPIYDRYLRASHLFVEHFVVSTSIGSKEDFLVSVHPEIGFFKWI
jgi:hypothetical protein